MARREADPCDREHATGEEETGCSVRVPDQGEQPALKVTKTDFSVPVLPFNKATSLHCCVLKCLHYLYPQILLWELGCDVQLPLFFRVATPLGQAVSWDAELTAGVYHMVEEVSRNLFIWHNPD